MVKPRPAEIIGGGLGLPVRRDLPIPLWAIARKYSDEALHCLVGVMRHGATDSAKITAASMVLDRGWGKAPVVVAGDAQRPITVNVTAIPDDMREGLERALRLAMAEGVADAIAGDDATVIDAALQHAPDADGGTRE